MSMSTVSNALENPTTNLSIHATAGASIWALHTYLTLPGQLTTATYISLQNKFGYAIGTALASRGIPTMLADLVPKMVGLSAIGGASAGLLCASFTPIVFKCTVQLKEAYFPSQSNTFQKECAKIDELAKGTLSVSDSPDEDDFVVVNCIKS